ncbi:MAG TPA: P-loop NTPase [Rectinemataceae bacterium]|nr:P-loop NTPase [Rectinemataceae bacterium]
MTRLLPIASGKGGVGKSLIAANLGVSLARKGKTVILVDLDLGGSNLHTFLGMRNRNPGIGSLYWKQERNLQSLLAETGEERLWLVPGDNLLPGVANLEWQVKKRILRDIAKLPADFVLLDLGAGSSWNVVDFWLSVSGGLLVVVPEITSVLNAYSFLKSAAFRMLSQLFPAGGAERRELDTYVAEKREGSGISIFEFVRDLARRNPSRGGEAIKALSSLRPCVIVNRAEGSADADVGYRLRDISSKNLGIALSFGAFLPEDRAVPPSLASRRPLAASDPTAPFSRAIGAFANRLAASPAPSPIASPGPLADVDLEDLAAETLSLIE